MAGAASSGFSKLSAEQVKFWDENGYLIVDSVFDASEVSELRQAYDEVLRVCGRDDIPDRYAGENLELWIDVRPPEGTPAGLERAKHVRKVEWPNLLHAGFEKYRTSDKLRKLAWPLMHGGSLRTASTTPEDCVASTAPIDYEKAAASLDTSSGTPAGDIKSYKCQINFKMPGGAVDFPWHQDIRPVPAFVDQGRNYVQTIIAVDDHTKENGCLWLCPGTHTLGDLKVKRYEKGAIEKSVDISKAVPCEATAGSVIMFKSFLVHGSKPNTTDKPRRAFINGLVHGMSTTMGRWTWRGGHPVPITSDHDYSALRAQMGLTTDPHALQWTETGWKGKSSDEK